MSLALRWELVMISDPMPDWLLEAAVKVSRKLGIEQNWFNDAAKAVAEMGLPDGILSRADPIEFGKKLTVLVASRSDLILRILKFKD
ncbi:MAG: hypothetical protein L3J39_10620 [Verrucomicrobiales bacterium]|nr:hypothetical protein [Verrucomicrobiales bacterium]